ncbi:hypothetical protein Pelo_15848 [Pelomyxa schiedti]|nr:hypothetical protein Pelo_15848 [Pelomyxa schiedti]
MKNAEAGDSGADKDDPTTWCPIMDCAFSRRVCGAVLAAPEVAANEARRAVMCAVMGWHKALRTLYSDVATCSLYCEYTYVDPQPAVRNALFDDEPGDEKGRIVTYLAAKRGHVECLQFFLEIFQPDTECRKGTPLRGACKKGHLECVKLLLSHFPRWTKSMPTGTHPARCPLQLCCGPSGFFSLGQVAWLLSMHTGAGYSLEGDDGPMYVLALEDKFRCLGAMPYAIASYVCVYQTHLPPLIPKFSEGIPPSQQVGTPGAFLGILSLPEDVLVRIFTLCIRRCTCAFHTKAVTDMPRPHLKYNEAMYGYSCFHDLPYIPWNLYECAYTLCTLELVCRAFHYSLSHEPSALSLPEQAAKQMCLHFGIATLKEGICCWKQQLMLHDIVGREITLQNDPEARKVYQNSLLF